MATEDNYFILTGANNYEQSPKVECYRLTKYDKDWKRIGSAGLYDCGTYEPIDAGSCRMFYQKPYMIARVGRLLYSDGDDVHHQATIGFGVNADEIKASSSTKMGIVNWGWVSHSFNQFVIVDEEDHMVSLDHGDTYDRGVVLYKNNAKVSTGEVMQENAGLSHRILFEFAPGGGNATNASLGGFEESSTHYISIGNSTDTSTMENKTRNIWITATSKDLDENNTYWLTNMPEDGENHVTTPHLIDLNNDTFMAIWSDDGQGFISYANTPTLYYAILDHDGKQIGKTYTDKGILSDCKPIRAGNKLIWYIHEGKYVTFYEINLDTMKTTWHTAKTKDWVEVESVSIEPKDFDGCLNDWDKEMQIEIKPANASDTRFSLLSANEEIVWCYDKWADFRSIGDTTLTVTTPSGHTDKANVHVLEALEGYDWDWIRYDVSIGQTVSAKIYCKPESLNKYVRYYSSDPSVASIDENGMVTGLKEGTAIIYSRIGNNGPIQEIKVVFQDVDSIWLDKRYLDMTVEETAILKVNYSPDTATNKTITWFSSDPKVATVDNNGKVTALNEGTAIITATSYNGKTDSCTVTVTKKIFATGISLNKTSRFLVEGGNETLTATVIPSDTTDKSVTWASSDTSVATVSNGKVTAVKTGEATITATTVNGLSATCNVIVVNEAIKPTGITLNKTELYVTYHNTVKLVASFLPENSTETETDVTWESDNDAVATVDKGEVYGKEYGKATITATTSNGLRAQCKVEIIGYVSSWGCSPLPSRMYVSERDKHYIVVSPEECQKYVTYESSDPSVMSVTNDGLLTALKVGKSTISIKCASQELLSKTIEVYALDPESVSLNYNQLDLHVGTSNQLQAYIHPDYANQTVTWQSSDQTIATVDNKGRVIGKSVGRATITATTSNGLTATCVVNVTENQTACTVFGFCTYNGKKYWYEDGKRQGVYGDPKNIKGFDPVLGMIERGREIYDPVSDGWYWLDAVYDGAAAFGKEVWMPYIYQDEDSWDDATIRKNANNADEGMKEYVYQCMKNKTGKWVRYDEEGKMLKGWVKIENRLAELYPEQKGNVYYYDHYTGLMAKGWITIDGTLYHFNEITGVRE